MSSGISLDRFVGSIFNRCPISIGQEIAGTFFRSFSRISHIQILAGDPFAIRSISTHFSNITGLTIHAVIVFRNCLTADSDFLTVKRKSEETYSLTRLNGRGLGIWTPVIWLRQSPPWQTPSPADWKRKRSRSSVPCLCSLETRWQQSLPTEPSVRHGKRNDNTVKPRKKRQNRQFPSWKLAVLVRGCRTWAHCILTD